MKLFISYSFKDDPNFQDIKRLLEDQKISFFTTAELLPGSSLSEQLRGNIEECGVCIFIATHNSVKSAWCGAELGAFWGAGKPVVIYVADSSLKESQLPQQFNGHLLERNMHRAVESAQAHLTSTDTREHSPSELVRDLTVAELRALIVGATQVASHRSRVAQLIFDAVGFYDYDSRADFEDRVRRAFRRIQEFIGQTFPAALRSQANGWRYVFTATTTTGDWYGFALHQESQADGMLDLYRQCLLLRTDPEEVIVSASLVETVTLADKALGLSSWTKAEKNVFAIVGEDELGEAIAQH